MILLAQIYVDETEIPPDLLEIQPEDWGTPGIALLLQDGDGAPHYVEFIAVQDRDYPEG